MVRSTCSANVDQVAAEGAGHVAQEHRPRVVGLVDPVAEAHDPVAPGHRLPDPGLGPVGRADVVEHVEGPARGARRGAGPTGRRWRR